MVIKFCVLIMAQQVMSNTVAEALARDGDSRTTETRRFVKMFNKFFDLLTKSLMMSHLTWTTYNYRQLNFRN